MTTGTATKKRDLHFESHAHAVLLRIRAALAELLTAVAADPLRPQDVARRFNLNKNLTWKISKIIRETDPALIVQYIPGKAGVTILLDSMKKAGAPIAAIIAVREAVEEFEKMREMHAGDRETLEAMIGGLAAGRDALQHQESQRRLSFRGNSAIWGVQARVQICVNILSPSSDPDFVDLAWISGLVDFRRLRRDTVWSIASTRKVDDDGKPLPLGNLESLDPRFSAHDAIPLLKDFCSDPPPELQLNVGADKLMRYDLIEGPLGNTAATTCIIGIIGRAFVRRTSAPGDTLGEHVARLHTPAELLIHDLFVHRDLQYAMSPEVRLYGQLPNAPIYPLCGRDRGELPVWEPVQSLGTGTSAALTPEMPKYRAMLDFVFQRLNWNDAEFSGFRFRMRYPPIPTVAVLRYSLQSKG